VVPASQRIAFNRLRSWLGRDVRLADEAETTPIFADCEFGAIPAVGAAYELETIVDNGLMEADDVYFEAGDHRTLVHLRAEDWRKLMRNAPRGAFCIN
jgi:Ala-tRNA(Pro) deacylase